MNLRCCGDEITPLGVVVGSAAPQGDGPHWLLIRRRNSDGEYAFCRARARTRQLHWSQSRRRHQAPPAPAATADEPAG